jgi:hypothetical protein
VHSNAKTWRADFVSQEAQDAVIGRVVREQAETRRNIEATGAEAHRLGKILEQVGWRRPCFSGLRLDRRFYNLADRSILEMDRRGDVIAEAPEAYVF